MKLSNTTCIVTQNVIKIIENSINNITVNEIQENTVLGLTIKLTESVASAYSVEAHGHMTSSNVQSALQELADTFKKQNSEPGSYVEGDLWYDIDDNELKIAKDVNGTLQFIPLLTGTGNMDTISGGTFV